MLHPVQLDPSLIGQHLPWDLYSDSGVLVAGADTLIADEAHYIRLIGRTLYRQQSTAPEAGHCLDRLTQLAGEADALLGGPPELLSAEALTRLSRELAQTYSMHPDACLGYPRLVPLARPDINHALLVLFTSLLVADQLELSEEERLGLAGAALTMNLTDPDIHAARIVSAGTDGEAERARLIAHPLRAADFLRELGLDDAVWLEAVRQHHENMDGSGYPEGREGARISLPARILRVVDAYVTRISGRHYRPPRAMRYALRELYGPRRGLIDNQIAVLLLRRMGLYPPGTLLRLASREHACVTRRSRNSFIRFAVSFMDGRGRPFDPPRERDLGTRAHRPRGTLSVDPAWPHIEWRHLWGY